MTEKEFVVILEKVFEQECKNPDTCLTFSELVKLRKLLTEIKGA